MAGVDGVVWISLDPVRKAVDFYPQQIARRIESSLTVGEERCKPYGRPRRNSRVPKLLAHRFFPRANFTLWVNPDLALMMSPDELVNRFLVAPGAVFAALRHFKRANVRVHICRADG